MQDHSIALDIYRIQEQYKRLSKLAIQVQNKLHGLRTIQSTNINLLTKIDVNIWRFKDQDKTGIFLNNNTIQMKKIDELTEQVDKILLLMNTLAQSVMYQFSMMPPKMITFSNSSQLEEWADFFLRRLNDIQQSLNALFKKLAAPYEQALNMQEQLLDHFRFMQTEVLELSRLEMYTSFDYSLITTSYLKQDWQIFIVEVLNVMQQFEEKDQAAFLSFLNTFLRIESVHVQENPPLSTELLNLSFNQKHKNVQKRLSDKNNEAFVKFLCDLLYRPNAERENKLAQVISQTNNSVKNNANNNNIRQERHHMHHVLPPEHSASTMVQDLGLGVLEPNRPVLSSPRLANNTRHADLFFGGTNRVVSHETHNHSLFGEQNGNNDDLYDEEDSQDDDFTLN